MPTSSVPSIQFTPTGLLLPLEADILAGVQADQNAAFGGNLNPALETPQGQLASSTAAIIGDCNSAFAELVNQVDPATASGFMQDAIAKIYFIERNPSTPSVVQCDCVGVVGKVIPAASQAIDINGNVWLSTQSATIPSGGTISIPFACQVDGPVQCLAGTLNQINQAVLGWDSVNNSGDAVVGSFTESRADFEFRRQQSVALNAHGTALAVKAAVFDLPDVIDVYVRENKSGVPIVVGTTNYTLVKHSIYVAVVGGAADAIAKAMWSKKGGGCDYNGNTAVTVLDESYTFPQPEYEVDFQRPSTSPVLFAVALARNSALPAEIVTLVKTAIINAFNGTDGGIRARIGSTIFGSRFYGVISAIDPSVQILSVLVGLTTATFNSVTLGIDQSPTISADNITVQLV